MHCFCFIRLYLPSKLRSCLFTDLKKHFTNIMAAKGDHMDRTAYNTREDVVSIATVIDMREETRTVKGLSLKIHDKRLKFKAGQWVDMFIPNVPKVGGFSICSSPGKLEREGILDLAVKYSTHPPAHWVHTQMKLLEIRQTYSHIRYQFHVTREQRTDSGFHYRRIDHEDISQALQWLNKNKVKAFICGPSPMLEDMERHIHSLGVANSAIMYEKWW
ncbi:hypothetical protein CHS0354_043021 [Potamilus streckersoni]|uniref:FAD-binding FR-type domain-containing protein n=1 Tax=Potamilus streckersoni TaxID=2493646 RepID=A0AAE0SCW8_9BIVA|nr:hypothetical protein CHS0354_043021 [Potamilus streckersoni]